MIDTIEKCVISISYITFSVSYDNGKQSVTRTPSNLGLILEHITNLAEVRILNKSATD
jgi:hypothetical protein